MYPIAIESVALFKICKNEKTPYLLLYCLPCLSYKWASDASDHGWFSFTLDTKADTNLELDCTYWGGDNGNRNFDILIDEVKIASQKLNAEKPNEFIDKAYDIPVKLLEGQKQITIKFQALPGSIAGGVFGCKLLRKGSS